MIDGPETIGLKLGVVDLIIVILVKDEVQDTFGLDLSAAVGIPDVQCGESVKLIIGLKLRDYY